MIDRTPFLAPAPDLPQLCTECGAPLTLEMEKDDSVCVDCAAEAAGMPGGRVPRPAGSVSPLIDEILKAHFPRRSAS